MIPRITRLALAVSGLLLLLSLPTVSASTEAPKRPNLIVVMTDDRCGT